ncbi:MAG: DUF134 domain-containing protein [Patescibacteria group bacterium]|jgi:predicted DNA-binding protein (UPF0251 family)
MVRPKIPRELRFDPSVYYFKPRGIPLRELEEIEIFPDELEALKLHDVDGLDQVTSSEKMKVSQPTFARILDKTYKKIADALINGKAIRIASDK